MYTAKMHLLGWVCLLSLDSNFFILISRLHKPQAHSKFSATTLASLWRNLHIT